MENQSLYPNTSLSVSDSLISAHTKIILLSVVLVWSLVGNILVIVVIFGNEGLKTNFNYLIVNMAISDLLIPVFSIPIKIAEEASGSPNRWFVGGTLGNVLCKLCYLLVDISPAVSVFTLLVISINRLIAIVFPVRAQMFSKKKGYLLIMVTWVIAAALFSPNLYVFKLIEQNHLNICIPMWPRDEDRSIFISTTVMILFLIPMIIITLVYSFLMYKVSRSSKTINNMLNNRQVQSRRRRNRQIFYISVAIVAAFIILWGPFFSFVAVVNFIWNWNIPLEPNKIEVVTFAVVFLGYLNPAVNPCIYFLFLKNYRQGLKRIFSKSSVRRCSETQTFYMRTLRSNGMMSGGNAEEPQCQLMHIKSLK